jgi:hypothetical protein
MRSQRSIFSVSEQHEVTMFNEQIARGVAHEGQTIIITMQTGHTYRGRLVNIGMDFLCIATPCDEGISYGTIALDDIEMISTVLPLHLPQVKEPTRNESRKKNRT